MNECMVWLTTGVISEFGQALGTDSKCIDQEVHTHSIIFLKIAIKIGYTLLSS